MLTPAEQEEVLQHAQAWVRAARKYERDKEKVRRLGESVYHLEKQVDAARAALMDFLKEVG